ncbi:MAG: 4Fe-4S binding protein [Sedimentisphaerales bacterium]|nr:4Fe-4S binding protein [Sedimentisphaerales bacterium]
MAEQKTSLDRRRFFGQGLWGACFAGIGTAAGFLLGKTKKPETLWQIDPSKCIACGNCATYCVLEHSAVKCVQAYAICGYCDFCPGYLEPGARLSTGAENELCPTGAIERNFIEDPYYEYNIIEDKCIACGKCVKACEAFGNGSLFLQVRHDRCVNCNECAIAAACPADAFVRVPVEHPYLLKGVKDHA